MDSKNGAASWKATQVNKDSIHSLFLFLFLLVTLFVYVFFYCCDENSSSVLTLFVSVFRIK